MGCDRDRLEGKLSKYSLCGIVLPRTTAKVHPGILNYTLISMSLPLNC